MPDPQVAQSAAVPPPPLHAASAPRRHGSQQKLCSNTTVNVELNPAAAPAGASAAEQPLARLGSSGWKPRACARLVAERLRLSEMTRRTWRPSGSSHAGEIVVTARCEQLVQRCSQAEELCELHALWRGGDTQLPNEPDEPNSPRP